MSGLTREMSSRLLTSLLVSSWSVVVLFGLLMYVLLVFWSIVAPLAGVLVHFWSDCSLVALVGLLWFTVSLVHLDY